MSSESCGCRGGCKEAKRYTPMRIYNPAGLSSLSYRIGTHARFKADMLVDVASQNALSKLTTRSDADLTISLLDSWATVADVLTFYQERIANEGFLKTATERRSVLWLARSIGYELRPGVAASTYLAFSLDSSTGSPKKATVSKQTKVQSIPAQGETPQVFETIEEIKAKQVWNEMKPRINKNQDLYVALENGELFLEGTSTKIKIGDGLLFVVSGEPAAFRIVNSVELDNDLQRTRVVIPAGAISEVEPENIGGEEESISVSTIDSDTSFSTSDLETIISSTWTESELEADAALNDWSIDEIADAVNSESEKEEVSEDCVYVFRVKCGVFGNNAPLWSSLPVSQRYPTYQVIGEEGEYESLDAVYTNDWDSDESPIDVNKDFEGNSYGAGQIYLDNTYAGISPESWVILNASNWCAYKVTNITETTLTGFSLIGKVTGLTLKYSDPECSFGNFGFRETTVYAMPEKLTLSQVSIDDSITGDEIVLDKMVVGLKEDQPILVSGELEQQLGISKKEIAFLSSIVHFEDGLLMTTLKLADPLTYSYKRDTVSINANLAMATHGETKEEAIGGGDPTQRFQQFTLKQSPLTYVSAYTPSGVESTLEIRVDNVEWTEVESFEDLTHSDNAYVTKRSDEGETNVIFGDGVTGRLPMSGQENIRASYRVGIGSKGMLEAGQLSLLMTRPLGVRSVTNPLKTSGGTDPESLDDACKNAPRTVLTLDRIVSLEDFKYFAQGFAGIGKAASYSVMVDGADVVLLAIASSYGEEVDKSSALYTNLRGAIESYKDPTAKYVVKSFVKRMFNIEAKITVSSDRRFEDVKPEVENALKTTFSFDERNFSQAVTISEVILAIQGVEGVEAVNIVYLYEYDSEADSQVESRQEIIRATGEKDEEDGLVTPSILVVNENGITIEEMNEA
ncbi:MAG: putative baseplate assembly protein [Thaumarchaeota archaeon]|nr:putative baseplate assembly protein [Nitrososphaerota archaeon]MCL5317202.1 putative baseplate assembly protein [Nitrososphaerota archaeon]